MHAAIVKVIKRLRVMVSSKECKCADDRYVSVLRFDLQYVLDELEDERRRNQNLMKELNRLGYK